MENISDFNARLEAGRKCGNCPMSGRAFVGCDSDDGLIGRKRIMFIGLNPGDDEARSGRPFTGPAGRLLREAIGSRGSWCMGNSLLCHSANQSGINGEERARAACRGNLAKIWLAFMPVVAVPCGNGAQSLFGIGEGITRSSNSLYWKRSGSGRLCVVAPLVHPSAILRNRGDSARDSFFRRVDEIFRLAEAVSDGPDFGFNLQEMRRI